MLMFDKINHWSIRNKIRLPIVLIAVIVLWMVLSSYRAMTSINDDVSAFDQRYLPAISAVLNADRDLYQALVAQRQYVMLAPDTDTDRLEALNRDRIENYEQALQRGLQAIELMQGLIEPGIAGTFRQQMQTWRKSSDQHIASGTSDMSSELFGEPRETLDQLSDNIDKLADQAASHAASTSTQQATLQFVLMLIMGLMFIGGVILAPILLVKPIERLRNGLRDISEGEGDLTARLDANSEDELGQVAEAFNRVMEKLQTSIGVVKHVNSQLEGSTQSLRSAADSNIKLANDQHETVDQVVTAVEEMHSAAREIATNSNGGAEAASEALESVKRGVTVSREANNRVEQLSMRLDRSSKAVAKLAEEAGSIAGVLSVIRGIAEQTNLLALNAAIEAARAGEQGRGFAVVAEEVRALASKTQGSTEDIQNRIETLQLGVDEAVAAMESGTEMLGATVTDVASAKEAFEAIEDSINQITDLSIQIATATEEQTHVIEEINRNLQLISDHTSKGTNQSRYLSDLSSSLDGHTRELTQVIAGFHV